MYRCLTPKAPDFHDKSKCEVDGKKSKDCCAQKINGTSTAVCKDDGILTWGDLCRDANDFFSFYCEERIEGETYDDEEEEEYDYDEEEYEEEFNIIKYYEEFDWESIRVDMSVKTALPEDHHPPIEDNHDQTSENSTTNSSDYMAANSTSNSSSNASANSSANSTANASTNSSGPEKSNSSSNATQFEQKNDTANSTDSNSTKEEAYVVQPENITSEENHTMDHDFDDDYYVNPHMGEEKD